MVRDDLRRAETEALAALSLDDLAKAQEIQAQQVAALQRDLPVALDSITQQLAMLGEQQALSAERQHQLNQRLLDAYKGTADLVVAALDQCQTILDADNTILESIERRLRAGGK